MLSNVSWMEYLGSLLLLVTVYYIYIIFRYYPDRLRHLMSNERRRQKLDSPFIIVQPEEQTASKILDTELFQSEHSDLDDIEELITKLVSSIKQASTTKLDETEFIWTLELLLKERPALKTSPYRPSINELIVSECAKHGTYALSEKEVDKMWEK